MRAMKEWDYSEVMSGIMYRATGLVARQNSQRTIGKDFMGAEISNEVSTHLSG